MKRFTPPLKAGLILLVYLSLLTVVVVMCLPALKMPQEHTYSLSNSQAALTPVTLPQGAVNVNTADEALLCTLPGIGPVTAKAIIDHRLTYGAFALPEDLMYVRGIGPAKLEAILPYICL